MLTVTSVWKTLKTRINMSHVFTIATSSGTSNAQMRKYYENGARGGKFHYASKEKISTVIARLEGLK